MVRAEFHPGSFLSVTNGGKNIKSGSRVVAPMSLVFLASRGSAAEICGALGNDHYLRCDDDSGSIGIYEIGSHSVVREEQIFSEGSFGDVVSDAAIGIIILLYHTPQTPDHAVVAGYDLELGIRYDYLLEPSLRPADIVNGRLLFTGPFCSRSIELRDAATGLRVDVPIRAHDTKQVCIHMFDDGFVVFEAGEVRFIEVTSGRTRWATAVTSDSQIEFPGDEGIQRFHGIIYVASKGRDGVELLALAEDSDEVLGRHLFPGWMWYRAFSFLEDGGMRSVVVADSHGKVAELKAETLAMVGEATLPDSLGAAYPVRTNVVSVGEKGGTIAVFHGAFLNTVTGGSGERVVWITHEGGSLHVFARAGCAVFPGPDRAVIIGRSGDVIDEIGR